MIDPAPLVAVDATGLEARHVSAYFRMRRGEAKRRGRRKRAWPKLTTVLHTHSHLIFGAVTGTGPTQDSPDFTPAMRQAVRLLAVDTVVADAAYDAEHNHRLCREELGLRASVIPLNPRSTGRRWPRTPYRRTLRRQFPHATYHQRWHAESGFSRHKRRLGSALTARSTPAHRRELILRVLTHNLMILRPRPHRISTEHQVVSRGRDGRAPSRPSSGREPRPGRSWCPPRTRAPLCAPRCSPSLHPAGRAS